MIAWLCGLALAKDVAFDSGVIAGLEARNIGTAETSGRISALAAWNDPSGKVTLYVGAASGGVWKSTDSGTTFRPTFDDETVQSIGAIAIDPSNPSNVWVGTGESWTRNSVSIGDGIYKSTDGGETWDNMGLPESERITRILVDPRSSDTVLACVPGKLWSDSKDRGLYRTKDGGRTWSLVLTGKNPSTGCGSVDRDPKNPDVLFASLWDFRRKGWTFRSGGEGPDAPSGSGLFRSADGGTTWTEIVPEKNTGFPQKPYGRIAVAVAPTDGSRVYASVESTDSGLFVSKDGGKTWSAGDKSRWMVWRPFYFSNLIVDPTNADIVYKTNGALIRSDDGGTSFAVVGGFNGMHGDVHDVWVDPKNHQHVIAGDDGGLYHSYDGGNLWWKGYNLPVSQFYHVSVDDSVPFNVYGGLQDNGSWTAPSAHPGGIENANWDFTCGGDGFWAYADPSDHDYIYCEAQGGYLNRVQRHTRESRDIQPKPNAHEKLRWNWNTPVALSPNDVGTIFIGSQFLFRSRDHGQTWDRISPDLTTNDPKKQKQEESGGITVDNSAAEMHTTIFAISESPKQKGVIWVGTDDGNVQITKDDGAHWTNVVRQVSGLPKNSWVSSIQASTHDAGTAYATFDRHTFGEMDPYAYMTTDFGAHWTALVTPKAPKTVRGYAHVLREDPEDADLLYLGTELGLWISIDRGRSWAQYTGSDFPAVAVRDIAVATQADALVLGTHGRGIWVLDDIRALRALTPTLLQQDSALLVFPSEQTLETYAWRVTGAASFTGPNPPNGALISWYKRTRHLFGKLTLEIVDPSGKVIDTLPASTHRGINRVVWSMHLKPPIVPPAAQLSDAGTIGPRVLPGTYTVRLRADDEVIEAPLVVAPDTRVKFSDADRKARFDAAMRVYELFHRESELFARITALREAIEEAKATSTADDALESYDSKLDGLRKKIVATKEGGAITGEERLREHTDQLYGAILSWEGPPSGYQLAYITALESELREVEEELEKLLGAPLDAVNQKAGTSLRAPPEPKLEEPTGGGGEPGKLDPDAAAPTIDLSNFRTYY